jgi:hypothetical protein
MCIAIGSWGIGASQVAPAPLSLTALTNEMNPWLYPQEEDTSESSWMLSPAITFWTRNPSSASFLVDSASDPLTDILPKEMDKKINYGVHVGQKKGLIEHAVTPPTGTFHGKMFDGVFLSQTQPLTYAGWTVQHSISPSLNVTYALSVGKGPSLAEDGEISPLDHPVTLDTSCPEGPQSAPPESLMMKQATSLSPDSWTRHLFAEALVTFVYSFCQSPK